MELYHNWVTNPLSQINSETTDTTAHKYQFASTPTNHHCYKTQALSNHGVLTWSHIDHNYTLMHMQVPPITDVIRAYSSSQATKTYHTSATSKFTIYITVKLTTSRTCVA